MLPVRHRGRVFVDFSCHLCSFDPPPPDLWGETPFPCPDQQWPLQQGPPGSEHGRHPGQDPAAPGHGAPRLCGVIQSHESPSPLLSGWHVGGEEQPAAHHSDTRPPPQPRVGFSLPGPRDGKWVVRAAVHSVLGVPLPCVCAGRRGGAVTKGRVPSRSRTTPRRSCFPFRRMCRRASAGSVAEREGAAGSVPTSCPRLPGGPGPGRHGPSGAAQVSWGGRVPEMLLLGGVGGPALREMGLSSEVTVLSDILTLLLMKTVTLACRVIYCRILCSDSRISKSYDVLHMNLFAIDIPT